MNYDLNNDLLKHVITGRYKQYKGWELNKGYLRKFCSRKCFRCIEPKTKGIPGRRNFCKYAMYEQKIDYIRPIFESKVIKKDGCWGWKNKPLITGYAPIYYERRNKGAHCVSWMLHRGPIPKGMFVCHHCDNPICTNPDHLFLGTPKDNTVDMLNKGRRKSPSGEKHCHAKLKISDVIEIKRLLKEGLSCTVIGAMFKVNKATIRNIQVNKTWKDI